MTRIAGVTGRSGQTNMTRLAGQMLAQLPGANTLLKASPGICLGLSVADNPDMHVDDGILCVIDGIIFNFGELVAEAPDGYGGTQASLIAHLFRRIGFEATLSRLNGDFAIALYDQSNAQLWLGRDRFGAKPLYFAHLNDGLAFASQPWALMANPEISAEINPRYVSAFASLHYRTFDNRPEESPYRDINQLEAGSYLSCSGHRIRVQRYWNLRQQDDFHLSEAELGEQYHELLLDAVELRVNAATSNAFTLSGGLDSSSVLSCAHAITKQPQPAYSAIYADKTFDESDEIRPMLVEKVSEWRSIALGNKIDLFSDIDELIAIHNEPIATATWLSHLQICKAVSEEGYSQLFGGLGGDELNAGEYEYFIFHFADLARTAPDALLASEMECWARYHTHQLYPKSPELGLQEIKRLTNETRGICLPDYQRLARYADTLHPEFVGFPLSSLRMEHPFQSCLKNRAFQDLFFETLPCCLRAQDRNATSVGLMQTNPFLDYRLVEFMFRVDGSHKIRKGITKILLREAMKGILPEETRTRIKKVGWNAPAHRWFSGKNLDLLRDLVRSSEFLNMGIYEATAVQRLLEEHAEIVDNGKQQENHMMFLWQLVNLTAWMRTNRSIKRTAVAV